jgi:hypothetical protein
MAPIARSHKRERATSGIKISRRLPPRRLDRRRQDRLAGRPPAPGPPRGAPRGPRHPAATRGDRQQRLWRAGMRPLGRAQGRRAGKISANTTLHATHVRAAGPPPAPRTPTPSLVAVVDVRTCADTPRYVTWRPPPRRRAEPAAATRSARFLQLCWKNRALSVMSAKGRRSRALAIQAEDTLGLRLKVGLRAALPGPRALVRKPRASRAVARRGLPAPRGGARRAPAGASRPRHRGRAGAPATPSPRWWSGG